jgi:hypothetical protein
MPDADQALEQQMAGDRRATGVRGQRPDVQDAKRPAGGGRRAACVAHRGDPTFGLTKSAEPCNIISCHMGAATERSPATRRG